MKCLVTGRAGSGKSAVNSELKNRGLRSYDTDTFPGLARWEDIKTGQQVRVDPSKYVDYTKIDWNWQDGVLRSLLASEDDLFLCGSASNELDYHPLFDKVFVLTLDADTQLARLKSRPDDYGKDPAQQAEIIKEQAEFVEDALRLGAIAVDGTRSINAVVDEILTLANET
jgi:dephospho-CoA kinase